MLEIALICLTVIIVVKIIAESKPIEKTPLEILISEIRSEIDDIADRIEDTSAADIEILEHYIEQQKRLYDQLIERCKLP